MSHDARSLESLARRQAQDALQGRNDARGDQAFDVADEERERHTE